MRRLSATPEIPPPLELECLKVLWLLGEANVRDVRQALAGQRSLAYTTVMTILDRLARKGSVTRRKLGRSFVYAPVVRRDALRRIAVNELVACFFDGSPDALIDYLRASANGHTALPESLAEPRLDTALL